MVSKLRVLGSRARSELKECWQMRPRWTGGRSGRANSVQNRMCGRGGAAGDVYSDIPAGLRGKYRQAVAAKSGEWSTSSSTSSGEEDRKKGAWKQRIRSSEQGLMPRKRWRKGGTISCLSTRRRKRSRKRYNASRTQEDICRRTVSQQKRRCGSSEGSSGKRRSVSFSYRTTSIKNKMQDAEMAAELQSLQAVDERSGSCASQTCDCCLEALWQQFIAWEQMELRPLYTGFKGKWEQHKGRCQEEKKDEGIVKMNKSKQNQSAVGVANARRDQSRCTGEKFGA